MVMPFSVSCNRRFGRAIVETLNAGEAPLGVSYGGFALACSVERSGSATQRMGENTEYRGQHRGTLRGTCIVVR